MTQITQEEFAAQLTQIVKEKLSPDYEVSLISVPKNTKVVSQLLIKPKNKDFGPSYHTSQLYERYLSDFKNKPIDSFASCFIPMAMNDIDSFLDTRHLVPENLTYSSIKNNLFVQLVNTAENTELLERIPSFPYKDLSIIYRVAVELPKKQGDILKSFIVTNSLFKSWGHPAELYADALYNTRKIFPIQITDFAETLAEIHGIPYTEDLNLENYCVTNKYRMFGASTILYNDVLEELSRICDGSFYVVPSSIEEVFVYPEDSIDPEAMLDTIHKVNATIDPEEFLSNNLYYYDKQKKTLGLYESQAIFQSIK